MSGGFRKRNGRADVLVRYRVVSPGDVEVRLTIFEDGTAKLRDTTSAGVRRSRIRIDQTEVDALRRALAALPAARWSYPLSQVRPAVREFFREINHGYLAPTRFQLKREGRVIFGDRIDDDTIAAMLARLDALRVRIEAAGLSG